MQSLIQQIEHSFECRVDAHNFRAAVKRAAGVVTKDNRLYVLGKKQCVNHINRTTLVRSACGRFVMPAEGVPVEKPPPYRGGYHVRWYDDETPDAKYYHRKEDGEILVEEIFPDADAAAAALGGFARSIAHTADPYTLRNSHTTQKDYKDIPAGSRVEVSRTDPPFQPLAIPVVIDFEEGLICGTWDADSAQWFLDIPGAGKLSAATCICRLSRTGRFDFVGDPADEDVGFHLNYDTSDDRMTNVDLIKKSELSQVVDRHWLRYYRQPGRTGLIIRFSDGEQDEQEPNFYFGSTHVFEELGLREEETVVGARTSDGRVIARVELDHKDVIGSAFQKKCTEIRAYHEAQWAKGGGNRSVR